jgi:hypothetical protein
MGVLNMENCFKCGSLTRGKADPRYYGIKVIVLKEDNKDNWVPLCADCAK